MVDVFVLIVVGVAHGGCVRPDGGWWCCSMVVLVIMVVGRGGAQLAVSVIMVVGRGGAPWWSWSSSWFVVVLHGGLDASWTLVVVVLHGGLGRHGGWSW
jgi:hypothetical protein